MQKHVELVCDGLTLRGMMHIPENGRTKHPFVAIYHGFTGNKMEAQFMFVRLSRELEKLGIGSVRFDFSGSGESDGRFEDLKVTREIAEAKCIFEFMKSLECADKQKLFMLGMSMGGFAASVAAAAVEGLHSLVLWAPAGNMLEVAQKTAEAHKDTMDEAGRVDIGGMYLNKAFVDDVASVDVYAVAAGYKGSVLIVHGTKDTTVPINASYKYREIYGTRAQLVEIEGSDHCFVRADWKDKLMRATCDYLVKQAE